MKQFTFTTRGNTCTDYGIMCVHANVLETPPETIDTKDIMGAFSPLMLFTESQPRFELKIKVVIQAMSDIYTTMSQIKEWLMTDHEDKPIYLSNIIDSYWEGFLYNISDIQDYNDTLVTCDLIFNCKPLRQLTLGDEPHGGQFNNSQTNYISALRKCNPSKPTIVITPTSGLDTMTIKVSSGVGEWQSQTFVLQGLLALPTNKQLIISSEMQECYYIDNKIVKPCNHLMKGDFPIVFNGEFSIHATNISNELSVPFKIYPRWRVR